MQTFDLLPIVAVGDQPYLTRPGPPALRRDAPWWLLDAAKRSRPLGLHHLRLLTTRGRVIGLGISDAPIGHQRALGRTCRVLGDGREHTIVLEGHQVVSATHDRYLHPSFRHHVSITHGEASLWGGHLITWRRLTSGRRGWVLTLRPSRDAPEPLFSGLTRAQMETVLLAVTGASTRTIAGERGCGTETVRSHLRSIYRHIGCSTRVELTPVVEEWRAWTRMLDLSPLCRFGSAH